MQPPMPITMEPSLPRREGAYIERAKLRRDCNVGMKKKSAALLAKLIAAVVRRVQRTHGGGNVYLVCNAYTFA